MQMLLRFLAWCVLLVLSLPIVSLALMATPVVQCIHELTVRHEGDTAIATAARRSLSPRRMLPGGNRATGEGNTWRPGLSRRGRVSDCRRNTRVTCNESNERDGPRGSAARHVG